MTLGFAHIYVWVVSLDYIIQYTHFPTHKEKYPNLGGGIIIQFSN